MKIILIIGLLLLGLSAQAATDGIVIVPGFAGSWNLKVFGDISNNPTPDLTNWSFPPGAHEYDALITTLKDAVGADNVTVAFYDWRRPIPEIAENYIKPAIEQAAARSPTGKVDVVAHSMGGLVARAFIQGDDYADEVEQFITLGTPHYGLPDAYLPWEGGDFSRYALIPKVAVNMYTFFTANKHGEFYKSKYNLVRQTIPSLQQLLPTYDYIKFANLVGIDNQYLDAAQMQEHNDFLPEFNNDANLRTLLRRARVTNIAGINQPTVRTILVKNRSSFEEGQGIWADGKPDPLPPLPDSTEGDDGVPLESALLPTPPPEDFGPPPILILQAPRPNWFQRFLAWLAPATFAQLPPPDFGQGPPVPPAKHLTLNSCHTCLPHDAIHDVLATLGLSATINPLPAFVPAANQLAYYFASPVSVQITDPQGRHITKAQNQIPGAEYSDDGTLDGPRLVLIPNPLEGAYEIKLTGTGQGEFHIGAQEFLGANETPVTEYAGQIDLGQVQTLTVINGAALSDPVISPKVENIVWPTTFNALVDALLESGDLHDEQKTLPNKRIITTRRAAALARELKNIWRQLDKTTSQSGRQFEHLNNLLKRQPLRAEIILKRLEALEAAKDFKRQKIINRLEGIVATETPRRLNATAAALLLDLINARPQGG